MLISNFNNFVLGDTKRCIRRCIYNTMTYLTIKFFFLFNINLFSGYRNLNCFSNSVLSFLIYMLFFKIMSVLKLDDSICSF